MFVLGMILETTKRGRKRFVPRPLPKFFVLDLVSVLDQKYESQSLRSEDY